MRARPLAIVLVVALAAASCGEERASPNGPSGAPTPVALVITPASRR